MVGAIVPQCAPINPDEAKANAAIAKLLKDKEDLADQLKSRSEPLPLA